MSIFFVLFSTIAFSILSINSGFRITEDMFLSIKLFPNLYNALGLAYLIMLNLFNAKN